MELFDIVSLVYTCTMHVTLWTNGKDYARDKTLSSEDGIIIQRYSGMRGNNKRDDLILKAKYFVGVKDKKRQLIGEILGVTEIERKETRLFIIVIQACNDGMTFKTKNEMCTHYNWNKCDSNMFGITKH